MRFRKLRIAWSVGCIVLCVLLVEMWLRSYWWGVWLLDFGGCREAWSECREDQPDATVVGRVVGCVPAGGGGGCGVMLSRITGSCSLQTESVVNCGWRFRLQLT
jgi:hypothetical protein